MKYIVIRADGSVDKGMGHIIRCVAIAEEFVDRGIKPIFILKENENVIHLLSEHCIEHISIKSTDIYSEIEEVEQILKSKNFEYILTDSYWLSDEYLERLKKISKVLISIDDNSLYQYPSDIIINSNIYAKDLNYKFKNNECITLLGTKYLMLRKEFQNIKPIKIKCKVKRILVTMGGTDINNFTPIVLQSLSEIEDNITIDVVVGSLFKCSEKLIDMARENKNINLIFNPNNMKEVMEKCDLAISASGTTTYELGVLGIPTILISQIDNQINIAKKASDLGMMINLGKYDEIDSLEIYKIVKKLINDVDMRKRMNEIAISIIDSNGVRNIVNEIINYK